MKRIRQSPKGLTFTIETDVAGYITVTMDHNQMTFECKDWDRFNQSWYDWQMGGKLIQYAFPYLNADEREFLMTGLTPAQWDTMFPPER